MKSDYYLTQDGTLQRKENTVYFVNENTRRALPVNRINTIYAYGHLSVTSGVLSFLSKEGVTVHFFGHYGHYEGSFYPKEQLLSGEVLVRQVEHYLDTQKRLYLAKRFVEGAGGNILRNLRYYARTKPEVGKSVEEVAEELDKTLDWQPKSVPKVMAVEGRIRDLYYRAWDEIVPADFQIGKRIYHPPNNRGNTLISFGNSLCYATVVAEIYHTQLNPTVSYLHAPFERRFSLALDVAEIFKPIIVDRVIFKLVNLGQLKDKHFEGQLGDMLLSEKGRRLFLEHYNQRLEATIQHKGLKRKVSYRRLIRLELYKLIKHLIGGTRYKPLVMWW